jgi:LacI family transcriptional regulator
MSPPKISNPTAVKRATVGSNGRSTSKPRARRSGQAASGRITIRNVAEAAGVSIATVSFVLNDRPGQVISAPVRKKVLAAAQRLNYAPSAAAATLARKQTTNVAIIFYRNDHLITNPFYSFVVQGAIKQAAASGFNILFSFMHDEYKGIADLPKLIREKNAEGVLFMQSVSPKLISELHERQVATVAVDCHPYLDEVDSVYVDNHGGARLACEHLIEKGHRNIVMLTAPSDVPSLEDRRGGFLQAMEAAQLEHEEETVIVEAKEFNFLAGYEEALLIFKNRPEVTGIFCANDEMASGVLRAAHKSGRNIPQDLSVVGFDDIMMSYYIDPPLTTIGFDKEDMGRRAMARLLALVGKQDDDVVHEVLGVELVERASTGPAPQ